MEISVNERDDRIEVSFSGEIGMMAMKDLKERLMVLPERNKDIEINLEHSSYLDSTGIGLFITLNRQQAEKGKRLTLINVPENISNILQLSSLRSILE